jgi:hypothetical protein
MLTIFHNFGIILYKICITTTLCKRRYMQVKQGTRVKILKGESAGKIGVCVAKAPGSKTEWNVAFVGKGQVRVDEKDLELAPASE